MPTTRGRSKTPTKAPARRPSRGHSTSKSATPTSRPAKSPAFKSPSVKRRKTAVSVKDLNPTPRKRSVSSRSKPCYKSPSPPPKRLLLTTADFGTEAPPMSSTIFTMMFWVAVFALCEHGLRYIFGHFQHLHPILEDRNSRWVLARHIGTDFVACALCAVTGIWFWNSKATITKDYKKRLWSYIPGAHQTLLIFVAYQVKNLYDTFIWDDGVEFIVHHVFSFIAGWGSMYPGAGHTYALFYMGVSEISTTVLVVLANFDDDLGVQGLADAFPNLRMFWAAAFAVCFVVCRTILWPFVTWFIMKDLKAALASEKDERAKSMRVWLHGFRFICGALTVLQFLWLGQIFYMAKQELEKMF